MLRLRSSLSIFCVVGLLASEWVSDASSHVPPVAADNHALFPQPSLRRLPLAGIHNSSRSMKTDGVQDNLQLQKSVVYTSQGIQEIEKGQKLQAESVAPQCCCRSRKVMTACCLQKSRRILAGAPPKDPPDPPKPKDPSGF
ncbi:hypothetical protein R1sor_010888 [Riccia sorocarpa]|uniref:Uncharacterized protein n=1 Tax=Riccia sorocarpa TaxID=122646 RepID=A0ABD3HZC1_9MARC